jgi:hypothetical protein
MKIRNFINGSIMTIISMFSIQSHALGQSASSQYDGELFTARVMNVTVAKQNGNVFVTVLFRGKSFQENLKLGLARTGQKADDCATLLDSNGGQYVARKCLADASRFKGFNYNIWNGDALFMIKPNVDSIFVFEFQPVDRSLNTIDARYNFISDIEVNQCTLKPPHPNGWSWVGGNCDRATYSVQSLSFFNLTTK